MAICGSSEATHESGLCTGASVRDVSSAEKARSLKNLFEFHYTPKKASWLNMAEIELSALAKQCLDRRIGDAETLKREAKAWKRERNEKKIMIQWRFATSDAREKLKHHYEAVRN